MTTKTLHIYIEQGLQNVGAFAYSDMTNTEFDVFINRFTNYFVRTVLESFVKDSLDDSQRRIDDLQSLVIENLPLPVAKLGNEYSAILPVNYLHLISDSSKVSKQCVKNGKPVIYKRIYTNRLVDKEDLGNYVTHSFGKSIVSSPLSIQGTGKITVLSDGTFEVDKIIITYIKKPKLITFAFPDEELELSDEVMYQIGDLVIRHLASISEQNPQKIANITQELIK